MAEDALLDVYRLFEGGNNDAIINLLVAQLALQLFHIGVSEWVDVYDIDLLSLYNHSIAVSNRGATPAEALRDDAKQAAVQNVDQKNGGISKVEEVEVALSSDHGVDAVVVAVEAVEDEAILSMDDEVESADEEQKECPLPSATPQPLSQSLSADADGDAAVSAPEHLKESSVDIDSLTLSLSTEKRTELLNQKKAASKGLNRRKQSVTLLKLENDILSDPEAATASPDSVGSKSSSSPSAVTMIGGGMGNNGTLSLRQRALLAFQTKVHHEDLLI